MNYQDGIHQKYFSSLHLISVIVGLSLLGFEVHPGYKSREQHKSLLHAHEICCSDNYQGSILRL